MANESKSIALRIIDRVFPRSPDFFSLLNEQCDLAVEATEEFVKFMGTNEWHHAERILQLEHLGDDLKVRNIDVLNRAFSTPMDREDLYRAIMSLDHIINYAKTTVREMELLGVSPDRFTLEMAEQYRDGALALQRGYRRLATDPAPAADDANAARKAERSTEKVYRSALAELLDVDVFIRSPERYRDRAASLANLLEPLGDHSEPMAIAFAYIVETFKRREIYRHLSNGADRLAHAGGVLHDIVVKIC